MKRRKFLQNKLWRDRMPATLEKDGSIIHLKALDDCEYDRELRMKLIEETAEVKAAHSRDNLIEEIADVLEVIDSLCLLHKVDKEVVLKAQEKKRLDKGGFVGRSFVTFSEHLEGSVSEAYCFADPLKYPEIE